MATEIFYFQYFEVVLHKRSSAVEMFVKFGLSHKKKVCYQYKFVAGGWIVEVLTDVLTRKGNFVDKLDNWR